MAKHLNKIRGLLKNENIDAIYLNSKTMKKYLATLTGSGCKVLITRK